MQSPSGAMPTPVPVVAAVSGVVAQVTATAGATAAQAIPQWASSVTVYLRGAAVLVGTANTDAEVCYVCVKSCTSGTTPSSGTAPGTVAAGVTTANDGGSYGAPGGTATWTTADGAVWVAVQQFSNGLALLNTDASHALVFGRDPNITSSSTGIATLSTGQGIALSPSANPSTFYVLGSGTYSLVGQA